MCKGATEQNFKLDIKVSTASAETYVIPLSVAVHSCAQGDSRTGGVVQQSKWMQMEIMDGCLCAEALLLCG